MLISWGLCILQEEDGATLLVSAKFSIVSTRNIYLQFEEVSFPSFLKTYGSEGMGGLGVHCHSSSYIGYTSKETLCTENIVA